MSTIEEPPLDRYPVQTFVLEHDDRILNEAMGRELARGGQVYYLHNRVESIDQAAARIKSRFPDAEVAVAHGKMDEEQLGDVMQRMADGEIQILVCTTIIEDRHRHPQCEYPHHRGRRQAGAGAAPSDQRPGGALQPPRLCVSHLPQGKSPLGGGREAIDGHPGVLRSSAPASRLPCGIWRFAARGSSRRGAVGAHALGGLRHVFKAPGGGRAGRARRGKTSGARVHGGSRRVGQY